MSTRADFGCVCLRRCVGQRMRQGGCGGADAAARPCGGLADVPDGRVAGATPCRPAGSPARRRAGRPGRRCDAVPDFYS